MNMNLILKRGSGAPPRNLTVSEMLELGKLRTETFSMVIYVFEFNINLALDQVPKVEFIEEKKCLVYGGFQKVKKATSHPGFAGST